VVYDLINPKGGAAKRNPLSAYLGKSNPG